MQHYGAFMKRTRKWAYAQQEAQRLAAIGLNANQISLRLEVNRSTVTRWMKAGKLPKTTTAPLTLHATADQSPDQWAASVRAEFDMDATDQQLLTHAKDALALARDAGNSVRERLAAGAEYRATLRQLNLPAKTAAAAADAAPAHAPVEKPKPRLVHRRPAEDPRKQFMQAVNQ